MKTPWPTEFRLRGGRFDGKLVSMPSCAPVLVVPFSLGTHDPYPDRLWLDLNGDPLSPPTPSAYYTLKNDVDLGEWWYEFDREYTDEHWTPETYKAEMERRLRDQP